MSKPRIRNLLAIYRDMDPALQERAAQAGASCTKGCASCCDNLVLVFFFEALAIAQQLLETAPSRIDALVKTMRDQCRHFENPGFTRKTYFQTHQHCAFLTTERLCSIYPQRPAMCRGHYVASPAEMCAEPSGETVLKFVNMEPVFLRYTWKLLRMTADAHLPEDTYPLQVAVPWAIVWLRDGRREFERKQAAALGAQRLSFWTDLYKSDAPFVKGPDSVYAKVLVLPK